MYKSQDKEIIKIMSKLKESNYTYKELKKLWYSNNNTEKEESVLDNLYDIACKKNPKKLGMFGFEYKQSAGVHHEDITDIDDIELTDISIKPNFENIGCSQFKDKTYEMIEHPYINEFSLENHSKAQGDDRALIDLIVYINEGIVNADNISPELTIGKSRVFEFNSLIKDFIDNWDEFPDYHYLVPNLEKYFGILIEKGIISQIFMPNGGGLYSNITCPMSGTIYDINSKKAKNIIYRYLLKLNGGVQQPIEPNSIGFLRATNITVNILDTVQNNTNTHNSLRAFRNYLQNYALQLIPIPEQNDWDEILFRYIEQKFEDLLDNSNLQFNGDFRFILQEDEAYRLFQQLINRLEQFREEANENPHPPPPAPPPPPPPPPAAPPPGSLRQLFRKSKVSERSYITHQQIPRQQ